MVWSNYYLRSQAQVVPTDPPLYMNTLFSMAPVLDAIHFLFPPSSEYGVSKPLADSD